MKKIIFYLIDLPITFVLMSIYVFSVLGLTKSNYPILMILGVSQGFAYMIFNEYISDKLYKKLCLQ